MKPAIISQEILLFTGTSFTKKEFCVINPFSGWAASPSPVEDLENACWSGMLYELLPELSMYALYDMKIFIWNILSAEHFILISQGTHPQPVTNETSVDPHLFLLSFHLN
jgi:hypothetical protein